MKLCVGVGQPWVAVERRRWLFPLGSSKAHNRVVARSLHSAGEGQAVVLEVRPRGGRVEEERDGGEFWVLGFQEVSDAKKKGGRQGFAALSMHQFPRFTKSPPKVV